MNYDDIQESLNSLSFNVDASYVHGQLTSMICSGVEEAEVDDWLPSILNERYIKDAEYDAVAEQYMSFYRAIHDDLRDDGFNFRIIMSGDDEPLSERVACVNRWCGGFLDGLELFSDGAAPALHSDECAEIIEDIGSLAVVELDEDDSEDEQEFAFVTLQEHLRVVVQLLFEIWSAPGREEFQHE